jgi:tRNA pseudouridine55 synthase
VNGLIIVDKPEGITSHDVVARVRRILRTKRVGHTGTLDPFATGVMVILIGQATRLAQFLDKDEKEYEAAVQLGSETDTGDRTGSPIADCGLRIADLEERTSSIDWEEILSKFRGKLMQVPPMYSAKKIEGKKLYELARKGQEVERKAVSVTIHELELLNESEIPNPKSQIRIRVTCSAGTYIRTLAEDIGRSVGLGAHLAELRRTRAGRFDISKTVTMRELESVPDPFDTALPMDEAVTHLSEFTLGEERIEKTKNGLSSRTEAVFADGEAVRMIDGNAELIAIGQYRADEKIIQPKLVFG